MKYSFRNDYSEFAHPKILESIMNHSNEQNTGYGLDAYSEKAEERIKEIFGVPKGSVFFISGGTQANMVVISYLLKPYEAALTVNSGHINVHETGAVEASGHKIVTIEGINGKITPEGIKKTLKDHPDMHMVKIKMIYISNSTEFGTIYKKEELEKIYKICKENNLYLFIDGARLSSALSSKENNMQPQDFANLCDVFYVGGTKIGLLFGEAVVFRDSSLCPEFRYHIKNRGAMLAKGFVLGLQFFEVFNQNLYFEMGKHENEMANKFKNSLLGFNVKFLLDSPTNQQFPIFTKEQVKKIRELYKIEDTKDLGNDLCVRFCFSWFTKQEVVDELISDIKKILNK